MARNKVFSLDAYQKKSKLTGSEFPIRVDTDTICVLKNPLRVPFDRRVRLFELADTLTTRDQDADGEKKTMSIQDLQKYTEIATEIITLVGDDNVDKLIAGIDGDPEVLFAIFGDYFEAVGLGEASPSEG